MWLPRVVWGAADVEPLAGWCCAVLVKEACGGISKRVVFFVGDGTLSMDCAVLVLAGKRAWWWYL